MNNYYLNTHKALASIVILLFAIVSATAQNDCADKGLKGSPIIVKQQCYTAIKTDNGNIEKGEVAACAMGNEEYHFNEKGNYIEATGYDVDGKIQWKTNYNYNNGNKVEAIVRSAAGALQTKINYKYNETGLLTEEPIFTATGALEEKLAYQYNSQGQKNSTYCYKADETLHWYEKFEYDARGNKIFSKHYDANGNLSWQTAYKYDNNNNVIEEGNYDANNNEISRNTFQYTFDEKGNWTQQIVLNRITDDIQEPEIIIDREIFY